MAMSSPYFEAIRQKDYEILFLYEPYDEMILLQLNQFKSKALSGIEQENLVDKNKDDLIIEGDARSLSNIEAQELKDWFKSTLSNKIKYVKVNFQIDIFINFANNKKNHLPRFKDNEQIRHSSLHHHNGKHELSATFDQNQLPAARKNQRLVQNGQHRPGNKSTQWSHKNLVLVA